MNTLQKTKTCSECQAILPVTDFWKRKYSSLDGRNARCKYCMRKRSVAYELKHERREYKKEQRRQKPGIFRAAKQRWRKAHLKQAAAEMRSYREKHPDRVSHTNKRWRLGHKEQYRMIRARSSAIRKGAPGRVTAEEWKAIVDLYDGKCLRCGKKQPEIQLTMDHVIPLSKGGHHRAHNLQPLCKGCNSSKKDKIIDFRDSALLDRRHYAERHSQVERGEV